MNEMAQRGKKATDAAVRAAQQTSTAMQYLQMQQQQLAVSPCLWLPNDWRLYPCDGQESMILTCRSNRTYAETRINYSSEKHWTRWVTVDSVLRILPDNPADR